MSRGQNKRNPQPHCEADRRPANQSVTSGFNLLRSIGPMPATLPRSEMALNPPFDVRKSTMRWASVGPMPGRESRPAASVRLMFTNPPTAPAALDSPIFLTTNCSPSVSGLARFIEVWSASDLNPPAANTASSTREFAESSYTPGVATSPTTCTTTFTDTLADAPATPLLGAADLPFAIHPSVLTVFEAWPLDIRSTRSTINAPARPSTVLRAIGGRGVQWVSMARRKVCTTKN